MTLTGTCKTGNNNSSCLCKNHLTNKFLENQVIYNIVLTCEFLRNLNYLLRKIFPRHGNVSQRRKYWSKYSWNLSVHKRIITTIYFAAIQPRIPTGYPSVWAKHANPLHHQTAIILSCTMYVSCSSLFVHGSFQFCLQKANFHVSRFRTLDRNLTQTDLCTQ